MSSTSPSPTDPQEVVVIDADERAPGRTRLQRLRLITACVAVCAIVTFAAAHQAWYSFNLPEATATGADYQTIEGISARASITGVELVKAIDAPSINATTAGRINHENPSSRFGLPDASALTLIGAALVIAAALLRSRLVAVIGITAHVFAFRALSTLTDLVEDVNAGGYLNTRAIGVQVTELTVALGAGLSIVTLAMIVSLLSQERRDTRARFNIAADAKMTTAQEEKMPLHFSDWVRGVTAMATDKARAAAEDSARKPH